MQASGNKDRIFNDRICVGAIDPPLGINVLIGVVAIVLYGESIPA